MKLHEKILHDLKAKSSDEKAKGMSRYFKTGPGQYGEGDVFLGVTVPDQRSIVKLYSKQANIDTVSFLLNAEYHEARLAGVLILLDCFTRTLKEEKKKTKSNSTVLDPKEWIQLYLTSTHRLNNWDLVDTSAPGVLGRWLEDKDRSVLYKLAKSKMLWENRIAMVATLHFIRQHDLEDVFRLSEIFLTHSHDLMHKATGWMLREAWKKDAKRVEAFLITHKTIMPRTTLRYAIEKLPAIRRAKMMKKEG